MPHMERWMKTCLSIIDSYDGNYGFYISSQFIFFYDEFRVGAWDMFLSKVLQWSGFVGWNRWLEKMVGTNGKV
jgi:hypothetical protein